LKALLHNVLKLDVRVGEKQDDLLEELCCLGS